MKRFKVYEIPDVKIGATGRWPQRVIEQGYKEKDCKILFETDVLELASSMERILQKKHGYKVDQNRYSLNAIPTPESIEKQKATRKRNAIPTTQTTIDKRKATKIRNGTNGNNHTPESIAKTKKTKKINNTEMNNPEIIAKQIATKKRNGTMNSQTPESIVKQLETKRNNGTMNSNTPGTIAKCKVTREKNGVTTYNQNKVTCRDLRTGLNLSVTSEDFYSHDYLVGITSKKPNF